LSSRSVGISLLNRNWQRIPNLHFCILKHAGL
jgi:hypothetical protein